MSPDVPAPQLYPSGLKLATILLSLALGTLLVAIDTTIISVAIPKIASSFNSINDVGWYGSAYLLTLTALQPAAGTMFKLFNPKLVYLTSMIVFEGISTSTSCVKYSGLTDVITSGIHFVCFCTAIFNFHLRSGYCWHRSCRPDSGSSQHNYIYRSIGKKTDLYWPHHQYVWNKFLC